MNVPGSEAENDVSSFCDPGEFAVELLASGHIKHGGMPMLTQRLRYRRTRPHRDRVLAGGFNISDVNNIGSIKGRPELVPQRLGARITVGLEHHDDSFSTHAPSHFQSRFYLGGMMSVIIKDPDIFVLKFRLETTARPAKRSQRLRYGGLRYHQLPCPRIPPQYVPFLSTSSH